MNIRLIFLTLVAFAVSISCNKEKKRGEISTNDLIGEWSEVCKFLDVDSNGLDSGDLKYLSNPKDSFMWVFNSDNKLQFKENGTVVFNGTWFLTWPSQKGGENELYLYPDPDLEYYVYRIQKFTPNHLVIYCKQFVIEFNKLKYRWYGWELKR